MTYNTLNPYPSYAPKDLDDNAQSLDLLLLSPDATAPDRFGTPRKTYSQMERDAAAFASPNVAGLAALTSGQYKAFYFTGTDGQMATYDTGALGRTLAGLANTAAGKAAGLLALGAAALDSPTFTGTPKVPTAAAGTNTTQAASTAYVVAAITALINNSPTALDTLKELADALGDDPNFATTVTNALALKAAIDSQTFTGTPKAPTPTAGDNTTRLATTAFVQAAITALGAYTKTNLIGTVSQTAGAPTGAVFQTGTSGTMKYTKYADGRLEITGTNADLSVGASATAVMSVTFPVAFVDKTFAFSASGQPVTSTDVYGFTYIASKTVNGISAVYRNGATAQTITEITWMAVGRWY